VVYYQLLKLVIELFRLDDWLSLDEEVLPKLVKTHPYLHCWDLQAYCSAVLLNPNESESPNH